MRFFYLSLCLAIVCADVQAEDSADDQRDHVIFAFDDASVPWLHNLKLTLVQPGFAVNAETGLQPLMMGCSVAEVPISWINRTPDMGVSSFKLVRVGGGYQKVLWHMWLRTLGLGPYRNLARLGEERNTRRYTGSVPQPA